MANEKRRILFRAQWVERLTPPASGREDWWDTKTAGFCLRITSAGTKTWCVVYRVAGGDGRKRRMTLGTYPALSLADARESAQEKLLEAARGKDPAQKKQADKKAPTFAELAADYLEFYAKAKRADGRPQKLTWGEDQRKIKTDLKPWAKLKAKDVSRRDVVELLDGIKARGSHVHANMVLALVSKIYNVGIDRGLVESNPAHRMKSGRAPLGWPRSLGRLWDQI